MPMTCLSLSRRAAARSVERQVAASKELIVERLRALRESHRPPLNMRQAADLIGVDPRTYGRWENLDDPTIPYLSSIEKIATAYGIDPLEIIGDGESPFDLRLERVERLVRVLVALEGLEPDADDLYQQAVERAVEGAGRARRGRPRRTGEARGST